MKKLDPIIEVGRPTSRMIDYIIEAHLHRAFESIDRLVREGYVTEQEVTEIINPTWGDAVAESWQGWLGEDQP